jgi:glycosyltransferase involved in cell wall biosynthesis
MRLLFLSKRRPQQRDLLDRPYGRFHYLPAGLAALGHDVTTLLVSHQGLDSERREMAGVRWISHDVRRLGPIGIFEALATEASGFNPDFVVGCSDAWPAWIAHRLARRLGTGLVIDAYDNYESYMPWNYPLHLAWRRTIAAADAVTAAGPQLAALLARSRAGKSEPLVLPMAADPGFHPRDKESSRSALGLPANEPLIGYYGGWGHARGTSLLSDAYMRVRQAMPSARLVLTGNAPEAVGRLPGVITLGYLDDAKLPILVSSLDLACVITSDSAFGRYSYPAKLCEAIACGTPVVATATEPVRWMLGGDTRYLSPIGDARAFARLTLENIGMGRADYGNKLRWPDVAGAFDAMLSKLGG